MHAVSRAATLPAAAIFIRGFEPHESATLRRAWRGTREIARHGPLVPGKGAAPELVAISRGWAGRIMEGEGHRRQILDLLMRGDLCGLDSMMAGAPPDEVRALTPVTVECFDAAAVASLSAAQPGLSWALLRHAILQNATSRIGHHRLRARGATRRLTALIHDLVQRLTLENAVNPADPCIPLTQIDLADATGLTTIHVNRVIAELRAAGIISADNRKLRVLDWPALCAAAGADPEQIIQSGRSLRALPEAV